MMKTWALGAMGLVLLAGCTTDPQTGQQSVSQAGMGAGLGALGGAALGAIIDDDTGRGALIGAAVGALAGTAVGAYLDNQQAELNASLANTGTQVQRTGDTIVINVPSTVSFDTNSSVVKPGFYPTLDKIAATLVQYPQSYVDIAGHTDSTGTPQYNQQLSQARAQSIASYLISRGVSSARVAVRGFGATTPIASNDTPAGREQNRRVEIQIRPYTG